MSLKQISALVLAIGFAGPVSAAEKPPSRPPVNFNREVRPILSDACFNCHGPDEKIRKAKLRLDTKEGLFSSRDGHSIVVPGRRQESELFRRLTTDDEDDRMPPAKSGKTLTSAEIDLIGRWIDEGAAWEGHWAFVKPQTPPLPKVTNASWPRNEIDYFTLSKIEASGLEPSPPADRRTLIRRASFDLTGLPPTIEEVDAFLNDDRPDAYEKLVDRLLASPHYGERMAVHWLDLARYADTHGYHLDSGRDMWKWREWVIEAFNQNQPFDQFTLEQLAGDLLPNATVSQKVATGFNRNNMINFEGGAIAEEYLMHYVVDRVNTTSTVFLGLTMGCAQCHDHKYDPISQKDFYQFYAYFNAVPENGLDGRNGNAMPFVYLPTLQEKEKLAELEAAEKHAQQAFRDAMPEIDAAQREWENAAAARSRIGWQALEAATLRAEHGTVLARLEDGSIRATGENPDREVYEVTARAGQAGITAFRLAALRDSDFPNGGPGRPSNGNFVLSEFEVETRPATGAADWQKIELTSVSADFSQDGYEAAKAIDGKSGTGWAIDVPARRKAGAAWFACAKPIEGDVELRFRLRFESEQAKHSLGRFELAFSADPKAAQSGDVVPPEISDIVLLEEEYRCDVQKNDLLKYYREQVSPIYRRLSEASTQARKAVSEFRKTITTSMVMEQMSNPRETFMLVRGQYNQRGDKVEPGIPSSLPSLPEGAPSNRLGLAQWIVDPGNPLTARVVVNRFWGMVMGQGLVRTANDFGIRAEWPSHPELLDWLATEFVRRGWDVKQFMKLILTSATYQQASALTSGLAEKDPENRLYGRGPRFRLQAEFIRDTALAVSGLLVKETGGPSVFPYQPPGLWEELSMRKDSKNWSAQSYTPSHGDDLYRRSMYTFWKRTSPPPSLLVFDAPDRETCIVQRDRTTTPLQALVLMNDPTYVEASRFLARRLMTEPSGSVADRLAFAFRLTLARPPTQIEASLLEDLFQKQLQRFRAHPEAAAELLKVGEGTISEKLDPAELAAWTMIANTILNLDEMITKG